MPDTFACADAPIKLRAKPGKTFHWEPRELLDSGNTKNPTASITEPTIFIVHATDTMGCMDEDSVFVDLRDPPFVSAGNDQIISKIGTRLEGSGKGTFKWEPEQYLSCPECPKTDVEMPKGSVLFFVTLTDPYGCENTDDVLVTRIENDLFVPNSFSPNNDLKNDVFRPFGYDLQDYKLTIFNRWGQVIYVSHDIEIGWDGTYSDGEAGNGVYVWEISYTQNDDEKILRGTVSLIR